MADMNGNLISRKWNFVSPNKALAPTFGGGSGAPLTAAGNGRAECFGYAALPVRLEAGKTYQLRCEFRCEGLDDIQQHLRHAVSSKAFNDGIFSYERAGKSVVGENCFPGPAQATEAEVRVYFRFSPRGRVWWDSITLKECAPVGPRLVTVACRQGAAPKGSGLEYWQNWLQRAAELKADVALLPEMFNGKKPDQAETLDGPSGTLLANQARAGSMYVSASFYEQRGDIVYNTAPLYDRRGKLLGTYEKTFPFDPELEEGVTPGKRFPVFQTDFGKVGIIICYDSWFPETARMMNLKGAELLLFANAGYFVDLMPARAADNGLWIAVSSLNCPAGIWDSSGARGGEQVTSPTRYAPVTIRSYHFDHRIGMAIGKMDLSRKFSPHWWGGPMRSAPGGRLTRRTNLGGMEQAIAEAVNQLE